jgi:dTDP-4-amino-4,6-dideoxygalactose transaminase
MYEIPFVRPTLPNISDISNELDEVLKSGMISSRLGWKNVVEFEEKMKKYTGKKYAVALNSGTTGLHAMLQRYSFIDTVIIPAFTFHATALACKLNNKDIRYVDVDLETWTVDSDHLQYLVSTGSGRQLLLAANMFGNPPAFDEFRNFINQDLILVDNAQGIGATYGNENSGFHGYASSFSFSASKLITGGEGGLVCTDDKQMKDCALFCRHYGDDGSYNPQYLGLNGRIPEFNAIILNKQFDNLKNVMSIHREIANKYKNRLNNLFQQEKIKFQVEQKNGSSGWKEFVIRILTGNRDKIGEALEKNKIEHKKYWSIPLHKTKLYRDDNAYLPNTNLLAKQCLAVPMYQLITDENIDRICTVIENNI